MAINILIPSPLPDEQGVPDLDEAGMVPWKKYGLIAAGVAFACSYGYMKYAASNESDLPEQATVVAEMAGANVPARTFNTQSAYVEPEVVEVLVTPAEPVQVAAAEPVADPVIIYRDRPAPAIPRVSKGRSQAMVQVVGAGAGSGGSLAAPQQAGAGGVVSEQSAISAQASDGVERGYASTLQNTDRLVLQGVVIPCTLNNAINTQLSGDASCTVARDIWSADNSRILIAKGSRANGTYQIETTSAAVTRIGVQWGRIRTTDNKVAYLGSPASDQQGAAGIPADSVNYHFWAKFGSALAVSLIEGVFRTIGPTGNTGGDVVVNAATGTSSDLAGQVLAATVNLPATRKANAGSEVAIFLQRDIEFEAAP